MCVLVCPKAEENRRDYPDFQDWGNDTRTKACSLIKAIDFEFLMSFTTIYPVLAAMKGIITRLPSSLTDIYGAFRIVSSSNCNSL